MKKELWKGNEAIAEAAIRAGCDGYFGYPITPQNEILEYMAMRMPQVGRAFVQSESEVAAINMVYGAAAAGKRAMTSSSSPGISLKQEGISYIAATELPAVIVNVMRGGPGLGSIQPSQSDYHQATRGGGHGDYRLIVLAPHNIQEAADLTQEAFYLADMYRNPVMLLLDGMIGQMMEPIVWHDVHEPPTPEKTWAAGGRFGRDKPNFLTSLLIDAESCEAQNIKLANKYRNIEASECRFDSYLTDDAEMIIAAFGTPSRIARSAADELRKEGIKAGVFRPITLWPFPYQPLSDMLNGVKGVLTVEMNHGQMVDDIRLSVNGMVPTRFYGRSGGSIPSTKEVIDAARQMYKEVQ